LPAGGYQPSVEYLESRNYTEPLFVFAIMVVAASRPVLHFASELVRLVSGLLSQLFRINNVTTSYFVTLSLVPLLGSFITEPAAMTLAALLLKKKVFSQTSNAKLMYLTIGVLFVNISIGGALTSFAAPPILMVASAWGWDTAYVFKTFGVKAALAVIVNATLVTLLVRKDLPKANANDQNDVMPTFCCGGSLAILSWHRCVCSPPSGLHGIATFLHGLHTRLR
jgi:hypothetical protein